MSSIKLIHIFCAYTTGLGFLLRGIIVIMQHPLQKHRCMKTLPHIIDTGLLVSGILMVYSWHISLINQQWLLAKLITLLFYIAFGLLMLRWGKSNQRRWVGLLGGLLIYGYIVGAAHSKSVFSFFTLL